MPARPRINRFKFITYPTTSFLLCSLCQLRDEMIAKSTVSTLSKQISLFQHFKADQDLIGWAKKTVSEPEHFFILTESICELFATLLPLKRKGAAIGKWLLSKSGWQVRRCRLDLSGCIVIDDVQFGIFAWPAAATL